jgi:hypothetical protein
LLVSRDGPLSNRLALGVGGGDGHRSGKRRVQALERPDRFPIDAAPWCRSSLTAAVVGVGEMEQEPTLPIRSSPPPWTAFLLFGDRQREHSKSSTTRPVGFQRRKIVEKDGGAALW